jgi:hypothetical protein
MDRGFQEVESLFTFFLPFIYYAAFVDKLPTEQSEAGIRHTGPHRYAAGER